MLESIFFASIGFLLFLAAFYDLKYRSLPLWLIIVLFFEALSFSAFFQFSLPIFEALVSGAIVGGVIFFLYLLTKGKGIGEADILFAALIGILFSWKKGFLVFAIGNFLGLLIMLPLIVFLGKERTKFIPLVCFLVLAIFLEWGFALADKLLKVLEG